MARFTKKTAPAPPPAPAKTMVTYFADSDLAKLEKAVNTFTASGWRLHGTLILDTHPVQYIQTLIK